MTVLARGAMLPRGAMQAREVMLAREAGPRGHPRARRRR